MTSRILCRNLQRAAARCSCQSRRLQPAAALSHQPASQSLVPRSVPVMLLGSAKQSDYVGGYLPLTRGGFLSCAIFFGWPPLFIVLGGRWGGAVGVFAFFVVAPPRLARLLAQSPLVPRSLFAAAAMCIFASFLY